MNGSKVGLTLACVALISVFAGFVSSFPGKGAPWASFDEVTLTGATFLGGSGIDDAYEPSIAIADSSSIHISGFTTSRDCPVTPDAYDTTFNGCMADRFVSRRRLFTDI